ncbi:formate--tetrahydrofolate ligase [Enemella dayhoffiae]|uniref:Formate--tetrahydrofolate ligase n=1 Tax=Enemella dayhoffiae TaxID=2016507 RepID=A0A255H997_9ACTN|nr:formate--tetrahydrofolate ligase [Enemella dayhoffiae]OYO24177.1 formate--tetrahydrofolate ligase [Enemella dayhoffiae]
MKSDLEIARAARPRPIHEVAAELGLPEEACEPYGRQVLKIDPAAVELGDRPRGRYVVVTAITPTPLGEGKTATTVGLGQAFGLLGRRAVVTIRQPSMGPTFGIKGGAAGGGYAQVIPMEQLNLHLTGDFHAVTAAHNLLAAMVDNHLHHVARGTVTEPELDPARVDWRRVLDVNDRALRNVVLGLGGRLDGVPRQAGFDITAASELMALLGLATDLADLRARLGRVVVGADRAGHPVTAEDLGAAGAMAVIMREAIKPNLLQTLTGTPALVHAGPFGNIATGNSSVVADKLALRCADFVLTEAGFGADMGAERFFNIKCRVSGEAPDAAVVVATVRGLKYASGRFKVVPGKPLPDDLLTEDPDAVHAGAANLCKQLQIVRRHGVPAVVAINRFPDDHASELAAIAEIAASAGARSAVYSGVADGAEGGVELAEAVIAATEQPAQFRPLYDLAEPLTAKIEAIATEVYGADGVDYSSTAERQLRAYTEQGFGELPICTAKTHLSISSDPALKGAPTGWRLPVREVRLAAGAGFVYPICGEIRTMPGLSARPAATRIDLDADGQVIGLS